MDRRTLFKMGLAALGAAVVPGSALKVRGEQFPETDLDKVEELHIETYDSPEGKRYTVTIRDITGLFYE